MLEPPYNTKYDEQMSRHVQVTDFSAFVEIGKLDFQRSVRQFIVVNVLHFVSTAGMPDIKNVRFEQSFNNIQQSMCRKEILRR